MIEDQVVTKAMDMTPTADLLDRHEILVGIMMTEMTAEIIIETNDRAMKNEAHTTLIIGRRRPKGMAMVLTALTAATQEKTTTIDQRLEISSLRYQVAA